MNQMLRGLDLSFVSGCGDMGALICAHDWSSTALGPPHTWTPLLRTSLSTLLRSKHPMFLAWGPDLVYLYNDAYRPILGLKHPAVLGRPLAEASASFWSVIRPLVDQALSGEGTWSEDLPLVTFRNGREETASFTFSFSPVMDETGSVAGLLCVGTETTARVRAEAALRASEQRLRSILQQAPGFMAVLRGPDHVFEMANEAFQRLVGQLALVGRPIREALPEVVEQGFLGLLDRVYATGEPYTTGGTRVLLYPEPGGAARERHVSFTFQPILDLDGSVTGILVQGHDITAQREIADAQQRRENVLHTALRAGRSVTLDLDLRTGISTRSDTSVEVLGIRTGPISDFLDRVHPDDRAGFEQARREVRAKGRAESEVRYLHPNGTTLWVIVRMLADFDEDGTAIRIYGLVTDLTERKQAEAQITFQASLLDAVEQSVMATDLEGRIIYYNKFAETLYGWSAEEAMGCHVVELCSGSDPARAAAAMAYLASGGSWSGEFTARHKDGSTFPAYVADSPIMTAGGRQIGIVGVSHDLRQQKQVEAELRASEEWHRLLAENATDIIVRSSPNSIRQYLSPSVRDVLGYDPEELAHTRAIDFVHPDDQETVARARDDLLSGRSNHVTFIYRHRHKEGRWVPLEASRRLVRDKDGKPLEFICFSRDISQRVRLEEQLRHAQKMEAMGQLTGGIAHDFNNLLAVILGTAEIIADDAAEPAIRDMSGIIVETAERGAALVQHLLSFGRRQTLKPVRLNLGNVVQEMLPLLHRTLGEHIRLQTEHSYTQSLALVDRTLLETALLNLVVNARDAMPHGGTLTILTGGRPAGPDEGQLPAGRDLVYVTVSDTGTGMIPEVQKRAFEPFFTTKEVGKGSGLGLSMVYGFAEQSSGHVSITSTPGLGTSVTIALPAAGSSESAATVIDPAGRIVRGSARVLIVEDEAPVLQLLSAQLSGLGYDVVCVSDAADALTTLEDDGAFRLFLTDIVLPNGMSGVELAQKARQIKSDLKVVYTSGYPEEVFRREGGSDESTPLLRKPFKRSDLAEVLRAVLE